MDIKIECMNKANLIEIYEFEMENRIFFESILPPRPDKYFLYESFVELMNEILMEQLRGECYMCIIRNESGKMVGRINLHSIIGNEIKKAELGYRIAEAENGKGYGTKAVKLMIEECIKKFNLSIIEAGTSAKNIGSQKVLIKNGFKKIGEEKNAMKINGQWVDGILFEKNCK